MMVMPGDSGQRRQRVQSSPTESWCPLCSLRVCVPSCFSPCLTFATLWTADRGAPLSMRFSRQECQSGLPCPPPGDLPNPVIELASLKSICSDRWVLYNNSHLGNPFCSLPLFRFANLIEQPLINSVNPKTLPVYPISA